MTNEPLRVRLISLSEKGTSWETNVQLSNSAFYRWSAERRPEMGELAIVSADGETCGPVRP